MAVSQNIGTMITAALAAMFAAVAPPGSNVPLIVGGITFGVSVLAAIATWTARETFRVHLNDLGNPTAVPMPRPVRPHPDGGPPAA